MSIHSETLFTKAQSLQPGESLVAEFASKRKAESVRVSLYRERNKKSDFTVSISTEGNKVFLDKEKAEFSFMIRGVDGTMREESAVVLGSYDIELQEIYESSKEAGYRQELIDELIDNLNERHGRRNNDNNS